MVADTTGPEDQRHNGRNRKPIRHFDAHRVIALVCRYPKHKWRFRVWQFMYIQQHVRQCYECNMRLDELDRRNPRIGPPQEAN